MPPTKKEKKCDWCDDNGFQWVYTRRGKEYLCETHFLEVQDRLIFEQ